ncbi:hypothetical protein GCM10022254_07980 [Actinomadura meridiana]|uniref:DUF397 domain-containing protein n=1 Tax=Actinomadura meridiana TaxID=559626 RepID=A0ABP8BTJ2_9ACTN
MIKMFAGWRVSSYSEAGGNCVEVGRSTSATVGVRDSTLHGKSPILEFTRTEWAALLAAVRASS